MILMFFVFIWPLAMLALGAYSFFFLYDRVLRIFLPVSILTAITALMSRRWATNELLNAGCAKLEKLGFDCSSAATYDLKARIAEGVLAANTVSLVYLYLLFPFLVVGAFFIQKRRQQSEA